MASPTPSALSQDDGGFTPSWVTQQEHQLGTLQSTEQSRREIQEMPSARPAAEEDDEESGSRPQFHPLTSAPLCSLQEWSQLGMFRPVLGFMSLVFRVDMGQNFVGQVTRFLLGGGARLWWAPPDCGVFLCSQEV